MQTTKDPAIVYCETNYPQTCTEFKSIMEEQYLLFCQKQMNYGPSNIAVGTQLQSADDVKLSLTGLWFRVSDKVNRLKQLVIFNVSDQVGESIEDTYRDLSIYNIIAQIVVKKVWGK